MKWDWTRYHVVVKQAFYHISTPAPCICVRSHGLICSFYIYDVKKYCDSYLLTSSMTVSGCHLLFQSLCCSHAGAVPWTVESNKSTVVHIFKPTAYSTGQFCLTSRFWWCKQTNTDYQAVMRTSTHHTPTRGFRLPNSQFLSTKFTLKV